MTNALDQYLHVEPYQEILSGIAFVLSVSGGVVKLTGAAGTGKSALCRELGKDLRQEKIEFASFEKGPESVEELHAQLVQKLRLDKKQAFSEALTRHIIKKPFDQQKLVLIFDDADQLSEAVLLELVALRSIELNEQGLVSILLSGSIGLDTVLARPEYQKLRDDMVVTYQLGPMSREQLSVFCDTYLAEMKLDSAALGRDRLDELLRVSGACPGEVLELLPDMLDQDNSRKLLKKKRQKELVSKATQTFSQEFVDPLLDQEVQAQVISRWKGPLGRVVILSGVAVAVFFAYAAYIFIPDSLIPAGVSYFDFDDTETALVAELPSEQEVLAPVVEAQAPAASETPALAEVPAAQDAQALQDEEPVALAFVPGPEAELMPEPPEPAAPAQAAPQAATPGSNLLEVVQFRVESWLQAWEAQDLAAYFGHYHSNFNPPAGLSLQAWRNQRDRNIGRPAEIAIAMNDFTVLELDGNSARVSFWMRYESPNYADRTLKELRLAPDSNGDWQIVSEENLQLERLTADSSRTAPRVEVLLQAPMTAQEDLNLIPVVPELFIPQSDAQELALLNFINSWLYSWQRQDVPAYFRFYTEGYRHPEFPSVEQWQADRRLKISRPSYIELRMGDFEVIRSSATEALVRVNVEYRTPSYADRSIKELLISRGHNGEHAIRLERNLRIERLPIYRRPVSPVSELAAIP